MTKDTQIFPLFGFTEGPTAEGDSRIVVSRGRTMLDAIGHVAKSGAFPRGVGIWEVKALPVDAAAQYTLNHPFDWLRTPPRYLSR